MHGGKDVATVHVIMFPAGLDFPRLNHDLHHAGFAEIMLIRTLRHNYAREIESLITRSSSCLLFTIAT